MILVPDLFGPGQDAYVIAGRFFAPVDVITANPGLSALIKTAADSGSIFTVTFQIDLSTGVPTGFAATTTLSGRVTLVPGGDIQIGAATLPNAVIDATARAALERALALGVPATVVVDGAGTLAPGGSVVVDITLTVTFTAPSVATPTPSPAELPNTSIKGGAVSAPDTKRGSASSSGS